ncbi:hypothetical protein X781_5120 [Mannheimia sp. USDA-ARS-USMARC-1261]|nr:hypothetical protein X781_5120 [Mannheimia sp. USDA-ARS-USMARC-1261]
MNGEKWNLVFKNGKMNDLSRLKIFCKISIKKTPLAFQQAVISR